ncbi:hypothetical protein A1O3_01803 [Capronia epimyces CBS 606.96]|uniref:AMP-dependent synthetase/ligase domain-containing protein n=1 Tax=Capronia epimyces CBS 606.96 TaxID=1182542 RepID=W9YVE6_9EURO|nr:uncharacterized protein A1O3_01803 [Capronia epimyces CBS 606.96]EXJ93246.1 hypothetical protein A1O3_01803 [Capronia epimyces CBS 606.96]
MARNDNSHGERKPTFQPTILPDHQPPFCLPVPGARPTPGETPPFRNARALQDLRCIPENGINTVIDLVRRASRKFGPLPAVGVRGRIQTHVGPGPGQSGGGTKQTCLPELSGYEYTSYRDYDKRVTDIGAGLVKLGLRPRGDKICIWAQTSVHWLALFHGAASQSIATVTAYSSLGLSGLQHALVATKTAALFVDEDSVSRLGDVLRTTVDVRVVVYSGDPDSCSAEIGRLRTTAAHIVFVHLDEVSSIGRQSPCAAQLPNAEDLCAIFFTSGSTGDPKGVPIKHKNVVAAVAGFDIVLGRHFDNTDRYLAYLPLAHVLEFAFEHCCLFWGVCLGYGSPRTLFDSAVYACKGDLRELRPTYMIGVPAIWETARKAILALVRTFSPGKQAIFWETLEAKKAAIGSGATFSRQQDDTVFFQAREPLGGSLRFMLTGGGPIAEPTQEFLSFVVAPLINGFGLTETMAVGGIMDPCQWHTGSLGSIPGCVEIKLVDHEEAGYTTATEPPEGEIWIRGASVAEGYWQNEEETEKSFTRDGWFKTGDIGRIDDRGAISIIDRKKNLVKTLKGEYIAVEKASARQPFLRLESIYRASPVVSNICISADSTRAKPIAIIIPVQSVLQNLAASPLDMTDPARVAETQQLVLLRLLEHAHQHNLPSIETIEAVVISPLHEWTPMNVSDLRRGQRNTVGVLT